MIIAVKVYQIILFMILIAIIYKIVLVLDEKTKFPDDHRKISFKYSIFFYIFNAFCFLFLNTIRENRKNDYYKYYVKYYKKYKKSLDFLTKYSIYDDCNAINYNIKTYNKILRYLKIKQLKK